MRSAKVAGVTVDANYDEDLDKRRLRSTVTIGVNTYLSDEDIAGKTVDELREHHRRSASNRLQRQLFGDMIEQIDQALYAHAADDYVEVHQRLLGMLKMATGGGEP